MFEESPLPSLAGHTGGSPAEQDSAPRGFSMESMLADIAEIPGIDPRGCLQGALLPRGISKLRVMDILNLFLEGVVEQIENPLPDERSEATTVTTAASTCATPCTGLSLASSSARSTMSRASHRLQMGPDVGKATKTSSYTPHGTQPSAPSLAKNARRGTAPPSSSEELRRLRAALQRQQALATAQAAQCQEFKDMSEQSNSELVAVEGEARDLRDEVARLSRQNKQLLLQLRQQRLKHQQELKLWQSRVGETGDVEEGAATASLLSYLQGASEQQDSQLRRDLSAQTAETVQCIKFSLRALLLEHFGQEGFPETPAAPSGHGAEFACRHAKQLWTVLHQLWSAETLVEDAVEEMFHSSLQRSPKPGQLTWPEAATRAEKEATAALERLSGRSQRRDGSESPVCRGPERSPPSKEFAGRSPDGRGTVDSVGCATPGSAAVASGGPRRGLEVAQKSPSEASPVSPADRRDRPGQVEGQGRPQRSLPTMQSQPGEHRPTTPSFGLWQRSDERSLSPQAGCREAARARVRPSPSVPAVLAAGPVLQRPVLRARPAAAAEPSKPRRQRSPDTSLSPRLPGKPPTNAPNREARPSTRPRSLSPEISKRASWL